jgi:hypothetical protein
MSHRRSNSEVRLWLARALWGWQPHPTQRQWLMCDAKTKVASCGRRWGKTEAAAIDAATMALYHPGSVQMIVSPTYDQSRLIFDYVERLMLGSMVRPFTKIVRTPYPRLTAFGSLIMARTADEDGRNLRGHSADRVIVDEAAYVRDSVIHEVISPMLADRNGQLVMVSTPFGKNHFYRAFLRGQEGDGCRVLGDGEEGDPRSTLSSQPSTRSFTFASWANPHISREYIEEQRNVLSPRQFAVEYEAQFLDDQTSVFPWDDIEAAAAAGDRCRVSGVGERDHECVVAGIDWARYSDYTAVVAVGVSEWGCEVVAMDRFNGMGWALTTERVAQFLRKHRVTAALTDQTSIGDVAQEQLRSKLFENGIDTAVEGYLFSNQSKRDLIEHLAMRFAQGTIAIPRDEQLMRELQYFEYELTSSGNVRMNARSGFHDDLVTALALACWQARSAGTAGRYLARTGRAAAGGW